MPEYFFHSLRRTALGGAAPVLVFIVLVFNWTKDRTRQDTKDRTGEPTRGRRQTVTGTGAQPESWDSTGQDQDKTQDRNQCPT